MLLSQGTDVIEHVPHRIWDPQLSKLCCFTPSMLFVSAQSICEDDFQYIGVEGAGAEELVGQDVEALMLASEPPPGSDLSLRCQVLVRLELAEPITVTVGAHASVSVSYLPPLRVQLVLPPGYPSKRLPDVEVLATWLPEETQSALEGHLREQGEAVIGAPVVFEWVQWLQVAPTPSPDLHQPFVGSSAAFRIRSPSRHLRQSLCAPSSGERPRCPRRQGRSPLAAAAFEQ